MSRTEQVPLHIQICGEGQCLQPKHIFSCRTSIRRWDMAYACIFGPHSDRSLSFRYCGLDKFRGLDNWLQVSQWKFELFPVVCIRDRPADLDNHWEGSMWWERTHNLLGIVCEIAWGHFLSCFCEIGWSFLHGHCDTWKVVYFLVGLHSCKEIGFDVIIGPA